MATFSNNESLTNASQRLRVTTIFILAGFLTIWLLCIGLIWHMRINRAGALRGDAIAAKKVILPAFEPLLIVLSIVNGVYIVFLVMALAMNLFQDFISPLVLEACYAGNQFMFMSVLVLMFQKSLSLPAVRRSVVISFILSYCAMCYILAVPELKKEFTIGLHCIHSLQMLPFVYAFIKPPSRATKRIIRELCTGAIVLFLLTALLMAVLVSRRIGAYSQYFLYGLLTYVAFCPLHVWRVLKADTEYWRGIGQRAMLQRENDLSEHISPEGLHVFLEINRKRVIDFAYLELIRKLGKGSMSTVFQGTLKTKTLVAVKAYSPTSCSDDVVATFSHQASMCSMLNHPNIVKFYGMCVAPPTICLVFQLCQGSLADTLSDQARRKKVHPSRQQLLISLGYMLDAARAVAYLHSFNPPFVHRDIKSSNFLVDAECNVQLSDFGEARITSRMTGKMHALHVIADQQCAIKAESDSPLKKTSSDLDSRRRTATGKMYSVEYAAPEILDEREELDFYGQAADVYSLAITMWDILHPSDEKFPHENGDQTHIIETVLHGVRPRIASTTPQKLRNIIERSWHCDPALRPSADQIVLNLEELQEELSARFVLELMNDLCVPPSATSGSSTETHHSDSFPGSFLVDHMIDRRFVRHPAEAVRMGNALMDSNILHHISHSSSFENSATALYYFDLAEAELCLPSPFYRSLDRYASRCRKNESMCSRGSCDFTSVRAPIIAHCQCRELGQRLVGSKSFKLPSSRQKPTERIAEPKVKKSTIQTTALLVEEDSLSLDDYNGIDIVYRSAATMA